MIRLAAYELSVASVVLRFYLLMTVVLVAGFTGLWYLGLLALPIFLSTMLGVRVVRQPARTTIQPAALPRQLAKRSPLKSAA